MSLDTVVDRPTDYSRLSVLVVPVRALLGLLLGGASVEKFVLYSEQVSAFTSYGVPAPELLVPIVGVVEAIAAILIGLGIVGRIGALLTLPVMGTAILTAGLVMTNGFVFAGAIAILVVGTGRYSLVTEADLLELVQSTPSGPIVSGDGSE